MNDAARLANIRDLHKAISPADWNLSFDDAGALVDARGRAGERIAILRFEAISSDDERRFVADAYLMVGFLLGLVDRATQRVRELLPAPDLFARRGLTDAEQRDQAGRCGCKGTDDMCACQNAADAATRRRWEADAAPADKNFAAEAAIKCGEPAFKKFLIERHGLESPASDERTAQKLRSLLNIGSRAELNKDDAAAAAWKALRGDFDAWKRTGR